MVSVLYTQCTHAYTAAIRVLSVTIQYLLRVFSSSSSPGEKGKILCARV